MGTMLEPMLSLSCLSSLNDVIQSGRYAEDEGILLAVLSNAATSYFTQGIPTLARQASQVVMPMTAALSRTLPAAMPG